MNFDDLTKKQLGLVLKAHRQARPTSRGPLSQTKTAQLINEISGAQKGDVGFATQNSLTNLENRGEISEPLRKNLTSLLIKWHSKFPKVTENALKSANQITAEEKRNHLSVISDLASALAFIADPSTSRSARDKRIAELVIGLTSALSKAKK